MNDLSMLSLRELTAAVLPDLRPGHGYISLKRQPERWFTSSVTWRLAPLQNVVETTIPHHNTCMGKQEMRETMGGKTFIRSSSTVVSQWARFASSPK